VGATGPRWGEPYGRMAISLGVNTRVGTGATESPIGADIRGRTVHSRHPSGKAQPRGA